MNKFGYSTPASYKRLEEVGDGTYGVVYKAENIQTKEIVALKKIKLEVCLRYLIFNSNSTFRCKVRESPVPLLEKFLY